MKLPKSFIRNRIFEIGITAINKPRKKLIEFYHKRLAWWLDIYGVKFKHYSCYLILKKVCF